MELKKDFWQSQFMKIIFIALLTLGMLIPLEMVRSQINDRKRHHDQSISDITWSWGSSQLFTGPSISYSYQKEKGSSRVFDTVTETLYPENLSYRVNSTTKTLHRSIYDVPVYTAEITVEGDFILEGELPKVGTGNIVFGMTTLKGIQSTPEFTFGEKALKIKADGSTLKSEFKLPAGAVEGDSVPFRLTLTVNGSESIFFRPVGNQTSVEMTSDYPDPSFTGDFLPAEREVREDGFNAKWSVSQITLSSLSDSSFGVRLVKPVTQYLQVERAIKYGILVIFLIFVAGFVAEMISKKPVNIIQYLVIGASLVLFYALLLAFSDFLSFGLSYLIAAVMTTVALGGYFIAIFKNKWAYLLTALVALAYGVIFILLRMETFAFLAGTLLLFAILCLVMYLTRNLQNGASETESVQNTN
ncbi:MAG: cell envelope integrity protein CreD [Bacteroidales bacterium]|nr:cell envelope integrity protein CreD [Bacteroidales bacterium]